MITWAKLKTCECEIVEGDVLLCDFFGALLIKKALNGTRDFCGKYPAREVVGRVYGNHSA